jgi:hypothetical protein
LGRDPVFGKVVQERVDALHCHQQRPELLLVGLCCHQQLYDVASQGDTAGHTPAIAPAVEVMGSFGRVGRIGKVCGSAAVEAICEQISNCRSQPCSTCLPEPPVVSEQLKQVRVGFDFVNCVEGKKKWCKKLSRH